jgi:hypothetical protein
MGGQLEPPARQMFGCCCTSMDKHMIVLVVAWVTLFANAYGVVMSPDASACPEEGQEDYAPALFAVGLGTQSCLASLILLAIEQTTERDRATKPIPAKEAR